MIRKLTPALGLVVLLFNYGCGSLNSSTVSQGEILRPATGITAPFEALPGAALEADSCKSPMMDPEDGTEVRMKRSFPSGVGDYSVPEGKYGLAAGELLRINCSTGEVLGIVKE